MESRNRRGPTRRLFLATAAGASALAIGLGTFAAPADAAIAKPTAGQQTAPKPAPKIGARKAPFSPRHATTHAGTSAVTPADAAANPWIVGVVSVTPYGTRPVCTGTIISPTKVLTAAGCDLQSTYSNLRVIAGRDDLADDSVGFVDTVASTWTDPNLTIPGYNDGTGDPRSNVQVLSLGLPLPSVYTPISLSAQGDESPYAVGGTATVVGYGLDYYNGLLDQQSVTTQAASVCTADAATYAPSEEVCEGQAAGSRETAGRDDLGLALVANGKQIGIGDVLPTNQQPHLTFERLSVYHDLVTADLARTAPDNLDWNGDGVSDLFGVNYIGQTTDYMGSGAYPDAGAGFIGQQSVPSAPGGYGYGEMMRVNNFVYDGKEGALIVAPGGLLEYYPESSFNQFDGSNAEVVGTGWDAFTTIVPTNNFTGDGRPDLLAVRPDGTLWLYERTGNGWVNGGGVQIGSGFNVFDHLTAFQWTKDGHVGLLGTAPNGWLVYYPTDGAGHWTNGNGETIGVGFGGLHAMISTGSFGATDTGSIMTVTSDGILRVYPADGNGGWLDGNGIQIGVGFQTVKQLY
jgi:hypothetical protein